MDRPLERPQLFLGSIPFGFDETRIWRELEAYGVRPLSLKFKERGHKDPFVDRLGLQLSTTQNALRYIGRDRGGARS